MNKPLSSSLNQPKAKDHSEGCLPVHYIKDGQAWYLVHCKSNSEKMALRNLDNQGFSSFMPLQEVTRRRGVTFQTKLKPLFPGYIFVAQNPFAGQWRKINNTRGVARLVSLGAGPTPVPPTIMNQLFERCDATGIFQQSVNLVTGDNVKISQGPFSGTIGKIIEIEPDQRVHLLFNFMGQTSKLELDITAVAPANQR